MTTLNLLLAAALIGETVKFVVRNTGALLHEFVMVGRIKVTPAGVAHGAAKGKKT